ncbi:MAG: response regulator transcription factor [Pseudomonadota bacterium]
MKKLIALTDDEPDIVELVTLHLSRAGFTVKSFYDGSSFLKFLGHTVPDLIILDLMLPDIEGLELCKIIRSKENLSSIPLILLTAKSGEMDKVLGLELGADDYITKPFSTKELVARVKAVLRRNAPYSDAETIEIGGILIMDFAKYQVFIKGEKVALTRAEFKILELLASKRGWVFSRQQILDYLWGEGKGVIDRTVDVHIRHLREKIGEAALFIKNIRGVGYKLEE